MDDAARVGQCPDYPRAPGKGGADSLAVAIIMDGNRRWAQTRGLSLVAGYQAGADRVIETIGAAAQLGVQCLYFYALSSENLKRPPEELAGLLQVFEASVAKLAPALEAVSGRLRLIGDFDRLPTAPFEGYRRLVAQTAAHRGPTVCFAFGYGGRAGLVRAAQRLATRAVAGEIQAGDIDDGAFRAALDGGDLPDPDLLIRTSGELRLSNFLPWQLAYTELSFSPRMWPDFGAEQFIETVGELRRRQRRYGQ